MTTVPRPRHLLAAAALAATLFTAGCAGGSPDSSESDSGGDVTSVEGQGAADDGAAVPEGEPAAESGDSTDRLADVDAVAAKGQAEVATPKAVISTATISLTAADVADARTDVQKIVARANGEITQEETSTDRDGAIDTARLVLRVPSARFEATKDAVEEVAAFESSTSGGDDVTAEVVDVAARIRAQEKSVRRIESLLARAENLGEIISIESDLSRRQADLDALKSRQQLLADQTSMATITVFLEQADVDDEDGDEEETRGFVDGLDAGWDGFVTGLVVAATVLGYLLPWLLALGILGLPLLAWLRSRRGRRTAPVVQP